MARKKEHKNGLDHKSIGNKEKHPPPVCKPSFVNGTGKPHDMKDVQNSDEQYILPTEEVKTSSSSGDGRRRNKKPVKLRRRSGQGMDAKQTIPKPETDKGFDMESSPLHDFRTSDTNHAAELLNESSNIAQDKLHTKEDISGYLQLSDLLDFENLKPPILSLLKIYYEWIDKQKPHFISLNSRVQSACDYIRMKCVLAYLVALRWLRQFGTILFFVLIFWLTCFLEGLNSFLHMGTASIFTVIWFGVLSVIAMVGMFKFLLVLAACALSGVFVGFKIGFIKCALSGAVILWIYGSFWTTSFVIILGGLAYVLRYERLALGVTIIYSAYCAWTYVGWLGLLLGFNLSFLSLDVLVYFFKSTIKRHMSSDQTGGVHSQQSFFNGEPYQGFSGNGQGQTADRSAGIASTSGTDSEITSEDEVVRLLNCTDHYSVLGLSKFEQIDISELKREYRKKAMLVHPDKNMGNEKAAEAFKKLQNAYEVLLDSLKRKAYDDELRREELLNYFRRFQSIPKKKGKNGFFPNGEDPLGEARRIACKKCGGFHIWFQTNKSKSKARWCQDCKDYHQAKDGDGWIEQSSQPMFFGILQKVDPPAAYVCADSKVYNATEWYICQGMRCAVHSHKPSFHVNTNITRTSHGRGGHSSQRGGGISKSNSEEQMTEEELYEWMQNSGMFGDGAPTESFRRNGGATTSQGGSSSKRKKRGKKW